MLKNYTVSSNTEKSDSVLNGGGSHVVQFYKSTNMLINPLVEYIKTGIQKGEACIVIAKPDHIKALEEDLGVEGIDVGSAARDGIYKAFDAAEVLAEFMINDLPDKNKFNEIIGGLIQTCEENGKKVRAYGEMVALLWKVGNREAVMQLENLWNQLAQKHDFTLYCAYPELHFIMDKVTQEDIIADHSALLRETIMV